MISEVLGINYYVIGPSLCLLITGVLFIISDLIPFFASLIKMGLLSPKSDVSLLL